MKAKEITKIIMNEGYEKGSKIIEGEFKEKTDRIVAYSIFLFVAGFLCGFMFLCCKII